MDQEKCNLKAVDGFQKGEINSAILNSNEEIKCMVLHSDTTGLSCISSYDISASSLINSPLVSELLISHGLLEIEHVDDNPNCNFYLESKISSIEDCVDSSQPITNNNNNAEDRKDDYKCNWEFCDVYFSSRQDLAQHVNKTHICLDKSSTYRCHWTGCPRKGKAINARYRMLNHIRTHTHDKPHGCNACGKEFSRVENLKIHIRSHTGEKPYHCTVAGCNKAFTNNSDRYKHSKRHQEDKPFVCLVEGCGKRYTDPSSLRKHKRSYVHSNVESNSNSNIEATSNDHNIQSSFNKTCINNSDRYKHSKRQQDKVDRPFVCLVEGCGKRYTDPSSLRKHKRSNAHGNIQSDSNSNSLLLKTATKCSNVQKPYACKEEGCNKRYTDPSSLRKHQRATSHGRDPNTFKGINGRNF